MYHSRFVICAFGCTCIVVLLPDESGSDSDGAESTSSSYSSLSDFVIDIQNSDINGETPGTSFGFHYVKFLGAFAVIKK